MEEAQRHIIALQTGDEEDAQHVMRRFSHVITQWASRTLLDRDPFSVGTHLEAVYQERGKDLAKARDALIALGPWLSAALSDERSCREFRQVCEQALQAEHELTRA